MRQRPQEVRMKMEDLIRIGDKQMRNPALETAALLLGIMEGSAFKVKECVGLGLGDNPGSRTFDVGDKTRSNISEELKLNPGSTWSMAHTHGPTLGSDTNGPSSADIRYANTLENDVSNYGVSLIAKVNADGGGFITFFDGKGKEIPWVITGLDGREYSQAQVRRSGWGNAWNRDAYGLSETQYFIKERSANNNDFFQRAVA